MMISYRDVLLRKEDLDLLKGPYWLNDQIVEFFFEYLQHEVVDSQKVSLVGGATTYFILHGNPSDAKDSLETLKLDEKEKVLFAVNDNPDYSEAEGGSHWSLLVFDRKASLFLHLDSLNGANNEVAKKLALCCRDIVAVKGPVNIEIVKAPRQQNGFDCALFVLKFAEIMGTNNSKWSEDSMDAIQSVSYTKMSKYRQAVLELIMIKGTMS